MVGADDSPIAHQEVYLSVQDSQEFLLKTDLKGIARFSLDTSSWSLSVSLSVSKEQLVGFSTDLVIC